MSIKSSFVSNQIRRKARVRPCPHLAEQFLKSLFSNYMRRLPWRRRASLELHVHPWRGGKSWKRSRGERFESQVLAGHTADKPRRQITSILGSKAVTQRDVTTL